MVGIIIIARVIVIALVGGIVVGIAEEILGVGLRVEMVVAEEGEGIVVVGDVEMESGVLASLRQHDGVYRMIC